MAFGLLLACLSGAVTATTSLFVKLASNVTVLQAVLFRNVIMLGILVILLTLSGEIGALFRLQIKTIALMLLRALASFIGLTTIYAVNHLMPLGDAAAIAGSASIFAGVFGALILGETWTIAHILLSIACWSGVVIVAQTNYSTEHLESTQSSTTSSLAYLKIVLAIASPMATAMSLVLSRKIAKTGKVSHLMTMTCFGMTCFTLISMGVTEGINMPHISSWKYLLCIALGGLLSQWLLTQALAQEKAAPVVLVRNSRVVVGFIYQAIIYHRVPTLQSLTGTIIIITTTVLSTFVN